MSETVHDFTNGRWGHRVEAMGDSGKIVGWSTPRPKDGDLATWQASRGPVTKRLVNVERCRDPADMWFASYRDVRDQAAEKMVGAAVVVAWAAFVVCAIAIVLRVAT